ncbi:MAG: beta-lactamase family protein [Chitinophagaceae bacterium]|nr:beta-lactamase family protein [Chitinophagaceae bacterium]
MKTIVSFLLLILIVACNASSKDKKPKDDSLQYYPPTPVTMDQQEFRRYHRELNAFFDTTLLNKGFNGGILIAKDGEVLYEKYVGKIDLRKNDSLTSSTSLHIASTSKTFTGIAILRMVEEKKLSLNDSLEKFFPGFPYSGITVMMLLSHRSGLPNYLYFMSNNKWGILPNGKWNRQYASNQDVLKMMYDKKPDPTGRPDGRFNYCNTNYVLLALIVEKISGKSFPVYMQEKLFQPLQMTNTYVFTLKDTLTATPSFTNNSTYWNYDFLDATYGDKNIYTTPQDLLKWDQALYTDQVMRKSLLDSAFAPYSFEKPSIHNYGLGWRLQILTNGKKVVYHYGKWHGSNAAFARLIDEKATIIIIGNRFNRAIYDAGHLSYDIFGDYQQRKVTESDEIDSVKNTLLKPPPVKTSKKRKD